MENRKQELYDKIEEARADLDAAFERLVPDYRVSSELYDSVEQVVDEQKDDCPYYDDLDDLVVRVENTETEEELDEIESDLDDLIYEIDNITLDDDKVIELLSDYFMYYSDAFDYLQNNDITDFDEAIEMGNRDICSIATYYLLREGGYY